MATRAAWAEDGCTPLEKAILLRLVADLPAGEEFIVVWTSLLERLRAACGGLVTEGDIRFALSRLHELCIINRRFLGDGSSLAFRLEVRWVQDWIEVLNEHEGQPAEAAADPVFPLEAFSTEGL
ncbi:hypothetical protein [Marinicauda sp. Alg238-R41]|uniref:hypothetical protein n=1 Tax=Marinicauda sp. Alg238-R41 TaxID=2993447 RepID=UPI0022E5EDD9|nr:hypothetical protein [Marinicauda sp. Alg238-R41]